MVRWFRSETLVGLKKNKNMWKVYLSMFIVTSIISYLWVRGIDNMKKNHPDYKGDDFLNWDKDENDENNIY
jgi:hypothetical protein